MKHKANTNKYGTSLVAPYVGAWIETEEVGSKA